MSFHAALAGPQQAPTRVSRPWSGPRDARLGQPSAARQLADEAGEAAQLRAFAQHPDVIALRTERVRKQVDMLVWLGISLGLGFTMVNVQTFAATGAVAGSLAWLAAWLLDPMVSLVLVAVLRAEQVTARYQVPTGKWVNRTKWFTFAATYVMNTWQAWTAGAAAGIVLHSVPPMLVFLASEMAPVLRDRLTEAVNRAAATDPASAGPAPEAGMDAAPTGGPAETGREPTGHTPAPAEPAGGDPAADTIEFAPAAAPTASGPIESSPIESNRIGQAPPRIDRGGSPRRSSGQRSSSSGSAARSIEQLAEQLHAAIAAGELSAAPSAEAIRRRLRIAPARARALRDQLTTTTSTSTTAAERREEAA